MLVQLARQLTRLTVIGTASRAETADWVRELGAHHVIDHSAPLSGQLQALGIDSVSHVASLTHTEQHFAQLVEVLRPQGRLGVIDDPQTLDVRRRIELKGDEELQARLPAREGIVEVTLKDGREVSHHTRDVRGTAENPMNRDEVDEKCFHLMSPIIGSRRSRRLCDAIWDLDSIRDIRELRPLFTRGKVA